MSWATYQAFRVDFQRMFDGDDTSSNIAPATLDLMISLGEALVYSGNEGGQIAPLRASSMLADFADVEAAGNLVADNAVALPADCLELDAVWFDPAKPLEVVPEQDLRRWLDAGGSVRKCAQAGDSLIFAAPAEDGAALLGRYYARPASLKTALNATFARYPELFLYAALYSGAPFLGFDRRIPTWQNYYRSMLAQANHTERMRAYAGSRLRVRTR